MGSQRQALVDLRFHRTEGCQLFRFSPRGYCCGGVIRRDGFVLPGYALLVEGEQAEEHGDDGSHSKHRNQGAQNIARPPLQGRFAPLAVGLGEALGLAVGQAGIQKGALLTRKGEVGLRGPALELLQAGAVQQEAGIAAGLDPLGAGVPQSALQAHVRPSLVQPCTQPPPLPQQGFVDDLHRRAARRRVTIKGEQARRTEGIDHLSDSSGVIA